MRRYFIGLVGLNCCAGGIEIPGNVRRSNALEPSMPADAGNICGVPSSVFRVSPAHTHIRIQISCNERGLDFLVEAHMLPVVQRIRRRASACKEKEEKVFHRFNWIKLLQTNRALWLNDTTDSIARESFPV